MILWAWGTNNQKSIFEFIFEIFLTRDLRDTQFVEDYRICRSSFANPLRLQTAHSVCEPVLKFILSTGMTCPLRVNAGKNIQQPYTVYRIWSTVCGTNAYHIWLTICDVPHMASHIRYVFIPHMVDHMGYTVNGQPYAVQNRTIYGQPFAVYHI